MHPRSIGSSLCASSALLALAVACGGKAAPGTGTVGNTADPAAAATAVVPAGIHACQFIVNGETYGPHRCDVAAGSPATIDKRSGMEPFTGTLAASADGVMLTATIGCGDMTMTCDVPFSAALVHDGDTWRGPVVPAQGGGGEWFLDGATFELTDAPGYGGATYGDAWGEPED